MPGRPTPAHPAPTSPPTHRARPARPNHLTAAGRPARLTRTTAGAETNSRLVSQAIQRAKEGDRDALGFLYARYADNIYGYVR